METNNIIDNLFEGIIKGAYQTLQESKALFSTTHKQMVNTIRQLTNFDSNKINNLIPRSDPERIKQVQQNFKEILAVDWQDAQDGVYPVSLLFDHDFANFPKHYLMFNLDLIQLYQRRGKKDYKHFSSEVNLKDYPQYYRRNFHYQTDGYLSDFSAEIYDLQVEILFNGIADPMRRRILKPLKEALQNFNHHGNYIPKVLDVGCGTGRTLKFIQVSLDRVSLSGIDLSPYYLKKAQELLSEIPGNLAQLVQGDGANLPYKDNYFHAVTNVFMFHELPSSVRQKVINESFRVLQPGGFFIICDSIQSGDSSLFEPFLKNFPRDFHEPYYPNYLKDDLNLRLEKAGFINIKTQIHCVSKYWLAHKPSIS